MTTDDGTNHRLEPWTEGDWRMAIGRLRAMGRHDLADELERMCLPFLRHRRPRVEGDR